MKCKEQMRHTMILVQSPVEWFECFSQLSGREASCESLGLTSLWTIFWQVSMILTSNCHFQSDNDDGDASRRAKIQSSTSLLTRSCHPSKHGTPAKVDSYMTLFNPVKEITDDEPRFDYIYSIICLCRLNWTAIPKRTAKVARPARGFIFLVDLQLLFNFYWSERFRFWMKGQQKRPEIA